MTDLMTIGKQAKEASTALALASTQEKNEALIRMAEELMTQSDFILNENKKDLEQASDHGISGAMVDRLSLTSDRIEAMAQGLKDIAALPDPIGRSTQAWTAESGIHIARETVPLGVIGIIYESRPNVTADAAGLCFKSGNAVVLRGGKEAIHSNTAIVTVLQEALKATNLPLTSIQLIEDTSRETAAQLMKLNTYIDVLIPRGGAGLIQAVVKQATVPVIQTGDGNCHIYVDETAKVEQAVDIIVNAKVTKPSACNAVETLLVHEDIAEALLPKLEQGLQQWEVECRADETAAQFLSSSTPATEDDWETEYLDFILAIKVVSSLDEAITHINHYSTQHSETIVTESYTNGQVFQKKVDSAAVYVNASTRFTDGFEFGFGAEIGISTQKLHARGPMGLEELTSIKTVIHGNGQIRK